ncbi:MAG TPA: hypothetical protein VM915_07355 [Verrucomicrobiae bacterium]|jgi:hypothetical protein|nr:hypothetical protein [Verrucomicrobiae bacterium]
MSYAFDVMARVFRDSIKPRLEDDELAFLFESLIEEMHSANHGTPSADGVFKGDGINKDRRVTAAARELDAHEAPPKP